MSAEDDLRQLIALAQRAVASSHNGADFSAAYKAQSEWHEAVRLKCRDPAYLAEYRAAVALLLPNYRSPVDGR